MTTANATVRWSELLPREFEQRIADCPIVYLSMGLCEPHGQRAALGLDLLKAEYLCEHAARRFGGVVAPSVGYHIHETGYHAPWLERVVGSVNPRMTSLPPHVVLQSFLYQLRAFANAGFSAAIVLTGHAGGNEEDLRLAARCFAAMYPSLDVTVRSDPELVEGQFTGDHAGRYELSQLLYTHPHLVDMNRQPMAELGRFAGGEDESEASRQFGKEIISASLEAIARLVDAARARTARMGKPDHVSFRNTERAYALLLSRKDEWRTIRPEAASSERDDALDYQAPSPAITP